MFSVIELFFGIGEKKSNLGKQHFQMERKNNSILNDFFPGQIIGPVLGGLLYQIGGFTLPFAVRARY